MLSDTVIVAMIAGIPATIAAIAGLIKLKSVETKIDGRLTQLLELTKTSSHAEGVKDEKAERKSDA